MKTEAYYKKKNMNGGHGSGGMCFFFNDTATTEIYTLSLHDALPISMIEMRMNKNFPKYALSLLKSLDSLICLL